MIVPQKTQLSEIFPIIKVKNREDESSTISFNESIVQNSNKVKLNTNSLCKSQHKLKSGFVISHLADTAAHTDFFLLLLHSIIFLTIVLVVS